MLSLSLLELVKGRLGNKDMPFLEQVRHIAVKEGEQQGPDVRAIHIGISHDYDAGIPELFHIKILANPCSHGGDHGAYLFIIQDLIKTGFFHVQDLSFQRQDRLEMPVPSLFGRTACRISLDNVKLAPGGVLLGAVGQFPGERGYLEGPFPPDDFTGLPGSLPGPERPYGLVDDVF